MECMYCYRKFSSKHSLATHKSRYHRPNFKSDCEDNEPFIRMMMKAILDGDIKLTKTEKNKLKPARESIRKIVHQEENLVDIFDKSFEICYFFLEKELCKYWQQTNKNLNNSCHFSVRFCCCFSQLFCSV